MKFRALFFSCRWWRSFLCICVDTLEISRKPACVESINFLPCVSTLWYSIFDLTKYIIFYRRTTQQPRLQITQIFANSFISYSRSMSGITFLNLRINNYIPQKVGIYETKIANVGLDQQQIWTQWWICIVSTFTSCNVYGINKFIFYYL